MEEKFSLPTMKLFQSSLARAFLISGLIALISFGFQALSARNLTALEFSKFASVIAFLNVFGTTLSGFQTEAIKQTTNSSWSATSSSGYGKFTKGILLLISIAAFVLLVSNSNPILGLALSPAVLTLTICFMFTAGLATVANIYFQRFGLFFEQTLWTLLIVTTNLAIQVSLVAFLQTSLEITLLISFSTNFLVAIYLFYKYGKLASVDKFPLDKGTLGTVFLVGSFWFSSNFDIILSPFFLSENEQGEYSLAASLSRNIVVLLNVVFMATFSKIALQGLTVEHQKSMFKFYLIRVVGLAVFGAVLLSLFSPFVVELIYGRGHDKVVELLPFLALATVPLVVASMLLQMSILYKNKGTIMLVGLIAVGSAISAAVFGDSVETMSMIVFCVGLLLCAVLFLSYASLDKNKDRLVDP